MKRTILSALVAALAIETAWAQWTPSDTEYSRMDEPNSNGQVQLTSLTTPEGRVAVTWLRRSAVADADSAYVMHLQLFDTDGTALFGDAGLVVANRSTRLFTNPYALTLAMNGDLLIGYNDIRNNLEEQLPDMFFYRYNQQGEPVWDMDGVHFPPIVTHEEAFGIEQANVKICESGDNLYVGICEMEYLPGEDSGGKLGPMSSDYSYHWQVLRIDPATGAALTDPLVIQTTVLNLIPTPDGGVYAIYDNEANGQGMLGQRLDADLHDVWAETVVIEEEPLNKGLIPEPKLATATDGGVLLFYRKINWEKLLTGYQVVNHLSPDGTLLPKSIICNGTMDGTTQDAIMAMRDDKCLVAYDYIDEANISYMYVNELTDACDYVWTDYNQLGIGLESTYKRENEWKHEFYPVGIAPQTDGWVLFYGLDYGDGTMHFVATKIGEDGSVVWSKQIAEEVFEVQYINLTSTDEHAYLFFTRKAETDDDGKEMAGTGGLFRMCVALSASEPVTIKGIEAPASGGRSMTVYGVDGMRTALPARGVSIIQTTDENGRVTTKKIVK